jgi:hypothetical protein
MPTVTSVAAVPGQPTGVSISGATTTSLTVSWQAPTTGGAVASYIVQFRPTGATSWTTSAPVVGVTSCQITTLQPATSYDFCVAAQNTSGVGAVSAIATASTSATQPTLPPQVTGVTATPMSGNTIQLSWAAQTGGAAATSFTVQYRLTGASEWTSSVTGMTGTGGSLSGLQTATSYDFSVIGANSAGAGPVSATVTAVTLTTSASVNSITWNLLPSGTYTHGSGTIGVNAQVSPADSPIQFGFSLSGVVPPSSWTAGVHVNSNLWGSYVPTPATAGTWYVWAEGLDGSAPTVSSTPFLVQ